MITNLSVQNFRVFQQPASIELTNITALIGANSSGKSSFLKAMLLLRENLKDGLLLDLNFAKGQHGLGDFNTAKSKNSSENEITFSSDFTSEDNNNFKLSLSYAAYPDFPEKAYLKELVLCLIDPKQNLSELLSIEKQFNEKGFPKDWLITLHFRNIIENKLTAFSYLTDKRELIQRLISADKNLLPFAESFDFDTAEVVLDDYLNRVESVFESIEKNQNLWGEWIFADDYWESKKARQFYKNYEDEYSAQQYVFEEVLDISNLFSESAVWLNDLLTSFHTNLLRTEHLGAFRGVSKRLYTYAENDYLDNLLFEYARKANTLNPNEKAFLEEWIQKFRIGEKLIVERISGIGTQVKVQHNNSQYDLVDLGFANAQLLPILLKVVLFANTNLNENKDFKGTKFFFSFDDSPKATLDAWNVNAKYHSTFFLIEEPESHLHPKLQSELADFFIEASAKFNIQFVIETHSEYLVRKLQYLVAKKKVQPEAISLHYVKDRDTAGFSKGVIDIKIKTDGSLSDDFGSGFYDEASKWMEFMKTTHN